MTQRHLRRTVLGAFVSLLLVRLAFAQSLETCISGVVGSLSVQPLNSLVRIPVLRTRQGSLPRRRQNGAHCVEALYCHMVLMETGYDRCSADPLPAFFSNSAVNNTDRVYNSASVQSKHLYGVYVGNLEFDTSCESAYCVRCVPRCALTACNFYGTSQLFHSVPLCVQDSMGVACQKKIGLWVWTGAGATSTTRTFTIKCTRCSSQCACPRTTPFAALLSDAYELLYCL